MTPSDLFLFSVSGLLVLLAVVFLVGSSKRREEQIALQAEKRGGELRKGGLFKPTRLFLPFKGQRIEIHSTPGGKNRPPKTTAQLKLDAPRLASVRMMRNDLLQKLLAKFGKEKLTSGDEEFDRQWTVETAHPSVIPKLVTAELKSRLTERSLRSLDLRIDPQAVYISIQRIPRDEEEFDLFIDTVLLILRNILPPL